MRAILYILIIFCHIAWAQDETGFTEIPDSQNILTDSCKTSLGALLPDPASVHATAVGDPVFYSQDLWDYIDGAAEMFHAQGFHVLIHQIYQAKAAEVTVDIYDMGSSVQAFGMYTSERSPGYQFFNIGLEGHGDDYGLNFLQRQFYIKLSIFSENSTDNLSELKQFAQIISDRIGPIGVWPEILSVFPEHLRVVRSEKFTRDAPLGHAFLSPAYLVEYAKDDSICTLILSEAEDEAAANERAVNLSRHFEMSGQIEKRGENYIGQNAYEGKLVFQPKGRYLVVMQSPFHGAEMLFDELLKRISKDR